MMAPYRSATPRIDEPRPLEPEDEMRLLLDGADQPRGVRAWVLVACTLVGLASLVYALVEPVGLLTSLYLLSPAITAGAAWLRYRRRLERLRKQGYDVGEATRQLRVATEPRVRIGVEPDESAEDEIAPAPGSEARRTSRL